MKLNILFLTLDDIMVLEFIGYSLEESLTDTNIGILEAHYEKDAMEILESTKVDLIIADMNIDTLESYEFYDKLQVSEKYNNIPFVFLSKLEDDHDIAILKGISNFFLKPLDVDQLLETLHNILKNSQTSQLQNNDTYENYAVDNDLQYEQNFYLDNILEYTNKIESLVLHYEKQNNEEIKQLASNIKDQVEQLSLGNSESTYPF